MPVLSKKASKEISNMINRLQVWTRIEANEQNAGNVSKAELARIIVAETEVALADEYGIILPAVGYARITVENHERTKKIAEAA